MTALGKRFSPLFCKLCRSIQPLKTPAVNFTQHSKLTKPSIASLREFSSSEAPKVQKKETVTINFHLPDNKSQTVQAKVGENLLDIILQNDVDIDGFGACEGTLACSTCHLIFKPDDYEKIDDKPTDEELDMLDLAYGLTDTSRLGCQVIVTKEMEGLDVKVPAGVADAREV